MNEPIFECANIPVAIAAKALKVDAQTVRLLLQSGAVDRGIAYHRQNESEQFSYLIYPKLFYEATGYVYQPDKGVHLNEYSEKMLAWRHKPIAKNIQRNII